MIPKYRAYSEKYGMREVVGLYWFDDHLLLSLANGVSTPIRTKDSQVELMQSTGLTDKNGVEIFEGDIVKMHYFYEDGSSGAVREAEKEIIGVVGIDVLGTYTECEGYKYYWLNYLELPEEELEVIGNIYENSELLEANHG